VNRVLPQVLEKSSNAADAELLETTVQQQGDADALSEARRVSAVIRAQAAQKALLLKQL
jgi:hypothetical protein